MELFVCALGLVLLGAGVGLGQPILLILGSLALASGVGMAGHRLKALSQGEGRTRALPMLPQTIVSRFFEGQRARGIIGTCQVVFVGKPKERTEIMMWPTDDHASPEFVSFLRTEVVFPLPSKVFQDPLAIALLNGPLLACARPEDRLILADGELSWSLVPHPDRADLLTRALEGLDAALYALGHGERSVPRRLGHMAVEDPDPLVREMALIALYEALPWGPEREAALPKALGDAAPGVRVEAAERAKQDGVPVLIALLDDDRVSPDIHARALRAWSVVGELDAYRPRARAALDSPYEVLRCAAIELLGKIYDTDSAPKMRSLLASAEATEMVLLSQTLARLGDAEAEASLLSALARTEGEAFDAVCRGLGVLGTPPAIAVLEEWLHRVDGGRTDVVKTAIFCIQDRMGGHLRGALALTDPNDLKGAVSPADTEGAVSVKSNPDSEG